MADQFLILISSTAGATHVFNLMFLVKFSKIPIAIVILLISVYVLVEYLVKCTIDL